MSPYSRRRLGLTAVALVVACAEPPPQVEKVIRPVRTVEVFSSGSQRARTFTGIARASTESKLSFKVGGTARRVSVQVGERVERGQLIAALDPTDFELQVQQAGQSLRRAEAEARNAAANLERARQLYENNNASRTELDAADAAAESTAAAVASAETALRQARRQLGYATLTAPIDGAIAALQVEVNENVQPGQTVVALTSGRHAEVQVGVPEGLIGQVREGSPAEVTFSALGRGFAATVTEVGVAALAMETTFPVTVRLDQDTDEVRPGMAADVALTFGDAGGRDVILVPVVAVGEDRAGVRFVYCVAPGADGLATVERRPVEVGLPTGNSLEILSGLRDGDRVITAGASRVQEGMTVRVPELGG